MACQSDSCHRGTQIHRAGVPHEALRRVQVPHQKAQTAACQCHGKQGVAAHLQLAANQGKDQHCHQCHRAAQTVHAVSQVHRIGQVQNYQHHQRIVEPRDVEPDKAQINVGVPIAQPVHCRQPQHCCHYLQYDLLHRLQPLVLLLGNLCEVVDKADHAEQQTEDHAAQQPQCLPITECGNKISGAEKTVQGIAHRGGNDAAENEQQSAHRRRTLLVGVPAGTEVHLNGLPEFQLVQPRQ